MASEEEKKQQGDGKGFAGLSSMVSDVDATVASTLKQTQRVVSSSSSQRSSQTRHPVHQEQSRPTPQTYQPPVQPSGGSSVGNWSFGFAALIGVILRMHPAMRESYLRLFGIAVVIGIIWFANQSDNNSSSRSAYSPKPSSTYVAPAPPRQPPAVQLQAPSRPIEDKPSIGRNNVLSTAQIRYCLAEKIRLDAAETVINNYNHFEVDRFNGHVNDYNSRCGEFRYTQGTLENVRRDVELYRNQLQAEGRSRFVRGPSATPRSPTPTQASQSARPTPDATVQAIQRRLNELGYDAGPVDGLFGSKTRAAIQAFQRDNGIATDGNPSQILLRRALMSERSATNKTFIQLSGPERESLEATCSTGKHVNGPAAYNSCLSGQLARLRN